ncbi:MAG: hypothetical protein A4E53_02520 [Pelotomaculum sp. PtaB.Bin104]|nr:MAG: hypothetical protein A4E53_02520 [Pelotomaculum sp. PtaB.Bin104]
MMREEAQELEKILSGEFGQQNIDFNFVEVQSDEIKDYPEIAVVLEKAILPLTVINGKPRFQGGLSVTMISEAVEKLLK